MKKFKSLFALVLVVVMIFALTACTTKKDDKPTGTDTTGNEDNKEDEKDDTAKPTEPAEPTKTDEKLTFGISMPQLDNDGFKANLVGIEQYAEENGIELLTTDAKTIADTQMQQIEDFITKGVDAIVMCPIDSGALAAAVVKANAAGIPVTAFDRNVFGGELAGLAESDNRAHGAMAADLMLAAAEKAGLAASDLKVLELQGTLSASAGLERHEGFSARAEELGMEIVLSLPTDFKMDLAYSAILDAYQANGEINAIYVPSDNALYNGVESALLQLEKLKPIGEEGHIIITTVDGGPKGLAGIRNNFIDAIAAQSKLIMSFEAMDLAKKAAKGEAIENPIVRIQPTAVTSENVDDETLWANAINK